MDGPAAAEGGVDGPAAAALLSSARSAVNRAVCSLLCNVVDTVSCEGAKRRSDAWRAARASAGMWTATRVRWPSSGATKAAVCPPLQHKTGSPTQPLSLRSLKCSGLVK